MSKVAINRNTDIRKGIWGALDLLGDLSELFSNTLVAIKPNDTWASEQDKTPAHPETALRQ